MQRRLGFVICWKNKEQEIVIKDGMLELEFGAFQIQTIRLSIEEAMA